MLWRLAFPPGEVPCSREALEVVVLRPHHAGNEVCNRVHNAIGRVGACGRFPPSRPRGLEVGPDLSSVPTSNCISSGDERNEWNRVAQAVAA